MAHPVKEPHIELKVSRGSDPIAGHVVDAAGREHPFSGWLELSSMLEALRVGPAGSPAGTPSATTFAAAMPGAPQNRCSSNE